MTEHEMLEAAKYIAKRDDEMHALRAALTEANNKLAACNQAAFEAGKFAGQQQREIDLLVASGRTTALLITKALDHLKQAHQAAHQGNAMEILDHLALAMAVLAQA